MSIHGLVIRLFTLIECAIFAGDKGEHVSDSDTKLLWHGDKYLADE